MTNSICDICGGCLFRNLSKEEYQKNKQDDFIRTISLIILSTLHLGIYSLIISIAINIIITTLYLSRKLYKSINTQEQKTK
jgi:hypothetical protein